MAKEAVSEVAGQHRRGVCVGDRRELAVDRLSKGVVAVDQRLLPPEHVEVLESLLGRELIRDRGVGLDDQPGEDGREGRKGRVRRGLERNHKPADRGQLFAVDRPLQHMDGGRAEVEDVLRRVALILGDDQERAVEKIEEVVNPVVGRGQDAVGFAENDYQGGARRVRGEPLGLKVVELRRKDRGEWVGMELAERERVLVQSSPKLASRGIRERGMGRG